MQPGLAGEPVDVLIRGVPPEVHAALTVRAKARQMSLRGYIVNLLSEAVSVPSDAVPAAIPPEVLAMPGVLAELAAATKRIEAHLLAPVVEEPVDTPWPPSLPEPGLSAIEASPKPDTVGEEPVERIAQPSAVPEPPMAVTPPPVPVVEAVASEIGSWLESWWSVSSARGVLAAVDVKLNRPDTDLTAFLARQGQSRTDFDQYLHRLMTQWSRKRSAPVPPDHAEALAAFAADLRAALAKRAEAVAPVPPGAAIPAEPSARS